MISNLTVAAYAWIDTALRVLLTLDHRLRIHRCATRGISCLTWMAWIRHTHAHFWQVQMQDFIRN